MECFVDQPRIFGPLHNFIGFSLRYLFVESLGDSVTGGFAEMLSIAALKKSLSLDLSGISSLVLRFKIRKLLELNT
jgi:hypothetical protein